MGIPSIPPSSPAKVKHLNLNLKDDFNAVGDGIADDTAAMNAAIAAMIAYGQNVSGGITYRPSLFIPAGVYKIGPLNTILNTSNLCIRGDANYGTKLRVYGGTDAPVFQIGAFSTSPSDIYGGGAQGFTLTDIVITNDNQSTMTAASGTSSGANSSTTLNDTSATFGALSGCNVVISSGTGAGQLRQIVSNTSTQLTVATWTTTPDATSVYAISFPPRTQMAIQDNGCGTLLIERVTIQGFKYGVCLSYGSDFTVVRDSLIRMCDVGLYIGPGAQQALFSDLNISTCRNGIVVDALIQARLELISLTLCEVPMLFEATNTANTRLGVSGASIASFKNYNDQISCDDFWFETGAGGLMQPFDTKTFVDFEGTAASTANVIFRKPYIVAGTAGMPTVPGVTYSFCLPYMGTNIDIDRPTVQGTRIAYVVDNANVATFPNIRIINPVLPTGIKLFSRPTQPNLLGLLTDTSAVSVNLLTVGADPYAVGSCLTPTKQTVATTTSQMFQWQLPRGTFIVTVRSDNGPYTAGRVQLYLVMLDLASFGIQLLQQIGSDATYSISGATPPSSITCALTASGVLQVTTNFATATTINTRIAYSLLQVPNAPL